MIKMILMFLSLCFIFINYYIFILFTLRYTYLIENYFHVKKIYLIKAFNIFSSCFGLLFIFIFLVILIFEFASQFKKKKHFIFKQFKEIFYQIMAISLWLSIQIPLIIISIIIGLGCWPNGIYNNVNYFLLCSIPGISGIFALVRKALKTNKKIKQV